MKHPPIPVKDARRAMIVLSLLFDVWGFLWHTRRELHNWLGKRSWFYCAVCWEIRLQVQGWKHIVRRDEPGWLSEDREIPF